MQRELIESKLGYTFKDVTWLQRAFTHPSDSQGHAAHLAYERLEYLGDAVLELVVSAELFANFPQSDEGELTKMRAGIVSRRHLAELAAELGWGEQLSMSRQLEKSGGRATLSVVANTFESVIGAIMQDSDYETARAVSLRLLRSSLSQAASLLSSNPKGELQEILQAINGSGPTYEVRQLESAPPLFEAIAGWNGCEIGRGSGTSKRKAEIAAAADALHRKSYAPRHT